MVASSLLGNRQYHIEFHGFLTNHVKHAVVALNGLHAPAERVQRYFDEYTTMVPYGFPLEAAHPAQGLTITQNNWHELCGQKRGFEDLYQFFDAECVRLGLQGTMQQYGPALMAGCAGALVHGVIHLGWALDAESRPMIIEGLAYQVYCHVTVHPEHFQSGQHSDGDALASLERIARAYHANSVHQQIADILTDEKYSEASGFQLPLRQAGFQLELAKVLDAGHPLFLELPPWLDELPVAAALEQLHKALAVVYLLSAGKPGVGGSFLVLHLVTGLWGAEHVVAWLGDEAAQRHGLKCFWAVAVAILVVSGNVPTAQALHDAWTAHDAADDSAAEDDWARITEAACWEAEEHNIKLAYVTRRLWQRHGHWQGFRKAGAAFTETPNIGPGREKPFYPERSEA